MSIINPAVPPGPEVLTLGAERIREFRVNLMAFWTAYDRRFDTGVPFTDPALAKGGFRVPIGVPAVPTVGDFFITPEAVFYAYGAGPQLQMCGDLEEGTIGVFHQASAPIDWERKTDLVNASFLRYVASGSPGAGGTVSAGDAFPHSPTVNHGGVGPTAQFGGTTISAHPSYRFVDILMATRL